MSESPYVRDILSQPQALEKAVRAFDGGPLEELAAGLQAGKYDRIVLAGMGASLNSAYPAWLRLSSANIPALWVDAAELIHHARGLVSSRTLLWLISQSGRSVEVTTALDSTNLVKPAALVATVNDLRSPLAQAADYCIPIHAEPEPTVSTRTYLNSLALGQLAVEVLLGGDVEARRRDLLDTASAIKSYLADWDYLKQHLADLVGFPKHLVLIGRGPSMCSANSGALILGEAAKYLATPFEAGEFRHGPLEVASAELTALIFEGPAETRDLNAKLLRELREAGTRGFWVGASRQEWEIEIPAVPAVGLPLMEIVPIQALSVHLAETIGIRPGDFVRIGKVTLKE